MKKVPESQISAMKAHNSQRKQNTAERVNKAIDKLKRKNAPINFEAVAKEVVKQIFTEREEEMNPTSTFLEKIYQEAADAESKRESVEETTNACTR